MMKDKPFTLTILAFSILAVLTLFIWQGNRGFNLSDEGYLWYGVQRVMVGEVPLRDFMAYDPGRYYWSAALMRLSGNHGIMTLRAGAAIFQTIGLFIGLFLIASAAKKQNLIYVLLSAITMEAWMFSYYKVFDIVLSIILIGVLTYLVQNPRRRRYFIAGLCVGLVAIFGRNHGLYGIAGSVGVMLWLRIKQMSAPGFVQGFALWATGVAVGFTPILVMAILIPGFAVAFWESVRFLFDLKATNLPLPIPWPWTVSFTSVPAGEAIRQILMGLFFIGLVVFGILSIIWVVANKLYGQKASPTLVATSFLAFPYAHYAFSRADVAHLSLGIYPLLIGCLALIASQPAKIKWPLALLLCGASLWVTLVYHSGWQSRTSKWANIEIKGDKLRIDPATASDVELLRKLAREYAPNGQSFIATPFWPGAYALLERKSPMWEIFALFHRSQAFEQAEMERIITAKPGFALIFDYPLDGHDALRFQNSHPLIHQYIIDHFERSPASPNSLYQIYVEKGKNL
jgi:hypothetical protein